MKTESTHTFRFKKGQRVKLRSDCADVYMRAWGDSEGFVGGNKLDDTGYYPMVYIVWDRDHWTWNGEENLWTFESHFEPVEKNSMADKHDDLLTSLAQWIEQQRDRPDTPEPPQGTQIQDRVIDTEREENQRRYYKHLTAGTEFAKDCEAFMLVAVTRQPDPTNPESTILIPEIFAEYLSEESGLLLETQLSQIAAGAHTESASVLIQQILEEREEDDNDPEQAV